MKYTIKNKHQISMEIEKFRSDQGGDYSEFYIGITRDVERRIYETWIREHIRDGIYDPESPKYVAQTASRDVAFDIEAEFQKLGMLKYNPGGRGKEDSRYIYCFKLKTRRINEDQSSYSNSAISSWIKNGKNGIKKKWINSFKGFFKIDVNSN